ncbi:MAG: ferrous iron transporter B [Candidatus Sericytochromatia bacterium]|nr:ferrous iron transporter B [Candidatus Sericytochromatia bacterium]
MHSPVGEGGQAPGAALRIPIFALAGQPNCGKTTLFNALTGSNYRTANYPGATVEYSVGTLAPHLQTAARIVDLPGFGTLNAQSPDEQVAVRALFDHPKLGAPDLVILVADATQLSRHLYVARQVLDSGFPAVLAVTMGDLLTDKGFTLDVALLAKRMACPVVLVDPRNGGGVPELIAACKTRLASAVPGPRSIRAPQDAAGVRTIYAAIEAIETDVLRPTPGITPATALHAPHPLTARLDAILLHPVWGMAIFVLSMMAIFTAIFWVAQPAMDGIDAAFSWLGGQVTAALPGSWVGDFVANGLISGISSVVIFVPQIAILFLAMGFLEDSGYLARGAMLVDKPLAAIGLNGRSFVPMLSGFACAIPAILAARTIPSRRERLLTILILPLMSCSARLPVYALLLAFLTPKDKPWIGGLGLTILYFSSLMAGAAVATIASKFIKRREPSVFMLELPAYRRPQMRIVLRSTIYRVKNYLRKAAVPIVTVATILWALTTVTVPGTPAMIPEADRIGYSYAAVIGHWLDPVMAPLGFDWRVGVTLIASFAAREVFVSSLALVMKVSADGDALQGSLLTAMQSATLADGSPMFTVASVAGLIVFFLIALQCMSTVVVSKKETGSTAMAAAQVVGYTGGAYLLAFLTVHGLRALGIA